LWWKFDISARGGFRTHIGEGDNRDFDWGDHPRHSFSTSATRPSVTSSGDASGTIALNRPGPVRRTAYDA
jgi:hypothetical protein